MARNTGVLEYVLSETRLLIQKNKKTGLITAHFMTIIGDPEYLDKTDFKVDKNTFLKKEKDFSGIILFHNLNGIFNIGWKYTDGKLTHKISNNLLLDLGLRLKEALVEADCYQIQIYETITMWHFNGEMEIIITSVETNIIAEYIECYYYGEEGGITGGGGAPSSTDTDTQPVQDCDCETCPICGGCVAIATLKGALLPDDDGTSGTTITTNETETPCPTCSCPELIPEFEEYPCLENILKTLMEGTEIDLKNLLINPTLTSSILNIFNMSSTVNLQLDVQDMGDPSKNGSTSRIIGTSDYKITFNKTYVENATDLSIARTFIHEVMHANLLYKFDKKEGEYSDLLNLFYESLNPSENDLHHSYFADNLIPTITDCLYEWCRQSSLAVSREYCEKMSWAGLLGISEYENHPDKSEIDQININEKLNNYAAEGRNCN